MKVRFELVNPQPEVDLFMIEQSKEMTLSPGELAYHFVFVKFNRKLTEGMGQREVPLKVHFSFDGAASTPAPGTLDKQLKLIGP